ncbi:MAG: helix-turn-helix transcriptional regulator [Microbacterium sp. SCN 70-18]|nr:helix-turn-helix transcriptional regulator [Microbacterium chocolatum]ODT11558.1 MAG: helix-turn-helix transcriptional regulator [Microbacterium sp. SCN 70-18]
MSDEERPRRGGVDTASARALQETIDAYSLTLESILAALRSRRLDDRAARSAALDLAASALIDARTATDTYQTLAFEPVVGAFARLRSDLRPLVRFGDLEVQFVEPPASGRALPGDIAQEARAIVRASVLAVVDEGIARRVRIQWDCDGLHLLVRIRDDGAGRMSGRDDALRPLTERVTAIGGQIAVTSTEGWGTAIDVTIPLDPPATLLPPFENADLTKREREVLQGIADGARNREIAGQLGIGENTVRFHVSNILRKVGARSRTHLAAMVLRG